MPADKVFATGEEVTFPAVVKAPDYEFDWLPRDRGRLLTSEAEAL